MNFVYNDTKTTAFQLTGTFMSNVRIDIVLNTNSLAVLSQLCVCVCVLYCLFIQIFCDFRCFWAFSNGSVECLGFSFYSTVNEIVYENFYWIINKKVYDWKWLTASEHILCKRTTRWMRYMASMTLWQVMTGVLFARTVQQSICAVLGKEYTRKTSTRRYNTRTRDTHTHTWARM